ncbi:hypothetical protein F4553_000419 [Allocatelliglobosispora scoriae]|uniref:Uncharacterized protein n=1 Tax=Allocatelliglobosispora scoriae TaxID=643052 RepID=A0A841BJP3_9ACTN|nr:hypothetical protein [Allocatelliglobosispora scoriae]MBB5867040.1 hypothetical protein [Allocatelliglobosispora scoriae]
MSVRTDLNGKRLRAPGDKAVYLVFDGKKSHVKNQEIYLRLFPDDWAGIEDTPEVAEIDEGQVIEDAYLAQSDAEDKTYFVANGWKRYISNADVFSRYGFVKDKARPTAQADLDALPEGDPLTT